MTLQQGMVLFTQWTTPRQSHRGIKWSLLRKYRNFRPRGSGN